MFKKIIKKAFLLGGYNIAKIQEPDPIILWDRDNYFLSIREKIKNHTIVDAQRCFILYQLAKNSVNIIGDVAEIGVYKGGTAKLLSLVFSEAEGKQIHLCDTFEGMPDVDPVKDMHRKGDFNDTSEEAVREFLMDCKNVVIHRGFFPETAYKAKLDEKVFSFVHVDVDIYKSVMNCCEFFYPRMPVSAVMVFDDYGALDCPGARKAVDDFFADKIETPIYLPSGQCVVVKK